MTTKRTLKSNIMILCKNLDMKTPDKEKALAGVLLCLKGGDTDEHMA